MVEFAFIMSLLFLLVFGIISFGLILSFQQDLTRSAAEGARAGAVAYPAANATTDAGAATSQSVAAMHKQCSTTNGIDADGDGTTCRVDLHDCTNTTSFPQTAPNDPAVPDCIRVRITYDYQNHPLVVRPPIISGFLPPTLTATSDARVNS
jgi:Flp pilus assembly protein TadG